MRVQHPLILGANLMNFHLHTVTAVLIPRSALISHNVEVGQRLLPPSILALPLISHMLQLEAIPRRIAGHDCEWINISANK